MRLMAVIQVKFGNQVYLRVESELKVEKRLAKFFSFPTEQAKFRRYNSEWDGVWRLYYGSDRKLLAGLYPRLQEFANKHKHEIEKHYPEGKGGNIFATNFPPATKINKEEFREWLDGLQCESSKPKEHEATAISNVLRRNRAIVRFSGGSKHPVLYYLLQWFLKEGKKCLLVAWDTGTVKRLYERFESEHVQKLYNRLTKNVKKPILIASWQSIYRQPEEWFERFDAVIVDEIDKFPAKSSGPRTVTIDRYKTATINTPQLQTLMEKITEADYRIGVTESNREPKIHNMLLQGLFGTVEEVRDEAAAEEYQSSLHVTRIEFNYPKDIRRQAKNRTREQEIQFLEQYERRNRYIRNLACALDGNTLVIVKKLSHGKLLHRLIHEKLEQERLKREVCMNSESTGDGWIIIATYQKIHYGLHVDCLDNVILSHPYKNDIRGLKSIGGNLVARNDTCNLYDIVDDLRLENWENHLMKEAKRRVEVYLEQKLPAKRVRVNFKR